jgi:hypothetical protein
MKKLLVILVALALVVAFSMPAGAVDVKVNGTYYVTGYYVDNQTLGKDKACDQMYGQRFRLGMVFKVAEGLKFTTRTDIMEGRWNGTATANSGAYHAFDWERAYVTFAVPFGKFDVGYQANGNWGTAFGNDTGSNARIKFTTAFGPAIVGAIIEKDAEKDAVDDDYSDLDTDEYMLFGIYKFEAGQAGLLFDYVRDADQRDAATPYTVKAYTISPYAKLTFGPVYVEGQIYWLSGTMEMDNAGDTDVDVEGRSAYIKAKYNFGPGNVGAMFMYAQGNDPASDDVEGQLGIGSDPSPCLILFGEKLNKWGGYLGGAYAEKKGAYDVYDNNVWLYQVFADYKVMPKLKLAASITYAKADEKPSAAYVDDVYGTEYDITATYSIYKNLSYKVGFGYLKAGDYFKGTSDANEIDDNYVVLNKLSLKF